MTLLKSINFDLPNKLKDEEYKNVFFEHWAKDEVAEQIRRLRKLRKLRQVDVAKSTGMKQSAISRIEQSEYSRWNFITLLRIAQALDARVRVVLEPSEDVIKFYESELKQTAMSTSVAAARKAEADKQQETSYRDGSHNLSRWRAQARESITPLLPPVPQQHRLGGLRP